MADNNKALLLASTILYSIAALVVLISNCVNLKEMDIPHFHFGKSKSDAGCVVGSVLCIPISLLLSMEVVAAVCSGLLYKQ